MKNYFVNPIGDFTDFYLAGHSFGAYCIGNYALKYSMHIKSLLLISPIGIKPVFPDDPTLDPYKRFEGKTYGPPRSNACLVYITSRFGQYTWDKKNSPLTTFKKLPSKV